jgi:propionyl-CoA carboxylase alpha chain
MFHKILIANRGEIAVRIIRTCRRLGIASVAVYSEIDRRGRHVQEADAAVLLGPPPAGQSYLLGERVIAAALSQGCQAIHPGYGFLSENAAFSRAVADAGLTFIGPPPEAISALGDKIRSKALALQAGVPIVPGHPGALADSDQALAAAEAIGYPVLLKPSAGGGGKGMRVVTAPGEMAAALKTCRDETRKAFGDDAVFLERFIATPRHVEIQVLADRYGTVIHLGERECSIQRRHQKIIEESPSVAVDAALRRRMGELACALARAAGYVNAGTVEFILDAGGGFYFLEMNTRLQVEHPVTEAVTGLDLVELQLDVAAGRPLTLRQEDVTPRGWAIEARICAEDPARGFTPATGMITRYYEPQGLHLRVDPGIQAGSAVPVHYDSLLAKVIAWDETREGARNRLVDALNGYHIEGPATNIDFVNAILDHRAFAAGELSTDFIARHFEGERPKELPDREWLRLAALASTLIYHNRQHLVRDSLKPMAAMVGGASPPKGAWDYMVKGEEDLFRVGLEGDRASRAWRITVDDRPYAVQAPEFEFYRRRLKLQIDGGQHRFRLEFSGNFIQAAFRGIRRLFEIYSPREWELARFMPRVSAAADENLLRCPMPGLVVEVRVQEGERVFRGQELVTIESMKMESGVPSPCDGVVRKVRVAAGQAVESGDVLAEFG